jgi:hypothetical protein
MRARSGLRLQEIDAARSRPRWVDCGCTKATEPGKRFATGSSAILDLDQLRIVHLAAALIPRATPSLVA